MSIRRNVAVVVAGICALALSTYLFLHAFVKGSGSPGLSAANECTNADSQGAQQTNPNSMQFVSCGGFID